jgi:hypothetical protein
MPTKQIGNATQAWSGGATWNILTDNQLTQTVAHLLNASGTALFIGDVVGLDATSSSTTGAQCVLPTAAGTAIGVVGGEIFSNVSPAAGGGAVTLETGPARTDVATVANGNATVTDASVKASDLFRQVSGTGVPAGAFIISVNPGTSFVMSAQGNAAGASVTISDPPPSVGPGWSSTAQYGIPPGVEVPVVILGFAWVNVGTTGAPASGALLAGAAGVPAAASTAAGAAVAAGIGTYFARALGGAVNTSLNALLGVTNRNLAPAYVGLGA